MSSVKGGIMKIDKKVLVEIAMEIVQWIKIVLVVKKFIQFRHIFVFSYHKN